MARTGEGGFMNAKNINILIDRIVLDGLSVPYYQESQFKAAVETELARLFTANALASGLQTGGAMSHISAGDIQLAGNSDPTNLGQQIARAVYESLSQ
jgi:hypothetical protein